MSQPDQPQLPRLYRPRNGDGQVLRMPGFYPTACGRWIVAHQNPGWALMPVWTNTAAADLLARHGISDQHTLFATRREALQALATALHAEGYSTPRHSRAA